MTNMFFIHISCVYTHIYTYTHTHTHTHTHKSPAYVVLISSSNMLFKYIHLRAENVINIFTYDICSVYTYVICMYAYTRTHTHEHTHTHKIFDIRGGSHIICVFLIFVSCMNTFVHTRSHCSPMHTCVENMPHMCRKHTLYVVMCRPTYMSDISPHAEYLLLLPLPMRRCACVYIEYIHVKNIPATKHTHLSVCMHINTHIHIPAAAAFANAEQIYVYMY